MNTKKPWRERIFDLTKIQTNDSTLQRKGQLLTVFFTLIWIMLFYTIIDNSVYFITHPQSQYDLYILEDILSGGVFYLIWRMNRTGYVKLAASLAISFYILFTGFFAPPDYIEYLLVIFAIPISISSFVIRPSSSFIFAGMVAVSYISSSIYHQYTWQYNPIGLISLFGLAFTSWVVAWRMENALEQNAELVATLKKSHAQIKDAYETTLEGWSLALDLRDKETEGHTQRVTDMTVKLARAMNFDEEKIEHIRRGALLHDIGKLGVPDTILLKPTELTEDEWQIMKQHPRYAYGLLYPIQYLRESLDIPCSHHEKWDGSGYPQGLKGEEIPLAARIFAIVDVYDALSYDRPYRKAWEQEKVLAHIQKESGSHFDPKIVKIFLQEVKKNGNENSTRQ